MGQKTIYVKEEDQEVFDEIERLISKGFVEEESLSSIVVIALKGYIQNEENKRRGMHEEELEVGDENEPETLKKIIFTGKKIACLKSMKGKEKKKFIIYHASKDNYLLYVREWPENRCCNSWYAIYSSLDEVNNVPDELIEQAKKNLADEKIIYLDV